MSRRIAPAKPCRHCGQPVYWPQLRRHEQHCQRITATLGTPQEMAAQFRRQPDLLVVDFLQTYPYVGTVFMRSRLLWGGVTEEEIAGRVGKAGKCGYRGGYYAAPPAKHREFCRRCEISLSHPGVPPGAAGYCGWCRPYAEYSTRAGPLAAAVR